MTVGEGAQRPEGDATGRAFLAANYVVLVLSTVGVANLWAQSGLRTRDAAILGALLVGYDLVATSVLPLSDELIAELADLPFAPLLAWPAGEAGVLGLGLGDTLLAAVFPLAMVKAFGRAAAAAAAAALGAVGVLLATGPLGILTDTFPLMVAQYGWWRLRRGAERTTRAFLQAEGGRRRPAADHPQPTAPA